MADMEDDPFAVFGDDNEEDDNNRNLDKTEQQQESHRDQQQRQETTLWMAQTLVAQANQKMNDHQATTNQHTATVTTTEQNSPEANSNTIQDKQACFPIDDSNVFSPPSSWPRPLYWNADALALVSGLAGFGGERGLLARQDISAGTLLMVEPPLVAWPLRNMEINETMILFLLQQPHALQIVAALEHFYPTKATVDGIYQSSNNRTDKDEDDSDGNNDSTRREQIQGMMAFYQSRFPHETTTPNDDEDSISALLQLAQQRNITNDNQTKLTALDIYRLFVALRYNSLESGVYPYVAMLNHGDPPNCVKFLQSNDRPLSEVRAIRNISAGQALTISYLPVLLSHATRRSQLWQHHRFDIGTDWNKAWQDLERIQNRVPPSSIHGTFHSETESNESDSLTRRIEKTTAQLTEELHEIQARGTWTSSGQVLPEEELERAQALELASYQLVDTAQEQLQNPRHVLLLPCRHLHLQVCDLVFQPNLSTRQQCDLLGRVIGTCLHLWQLQELVYGQDYFGLAETFLELAQAVELVLSHQATFMTQTLAGNLAANTMTWLQERHPRGVPSSSMSSISSWSTLEFYARTEHERIKGLYPRDMDQYIPQE